MTNAFLALGSNLGDRAHFLDRAVEYLRAEPALRVVRISRYYETPSVGGPADAPPYLNAVVWVTCFHSPEALLALCLEIERRLGRTRGERNAPRTLDLDVLIYGDVIRTEDPILPHPRMAERAFVLVPLFEMVPGLGHPLLGKTVQQILVERHPESNPPRVWDRKNDPIRRSLEGKRAFVTGSTGGIGRAIADELRRAGASVLTHGRKDSADIRGDLSDPAEQDRVFQEAWARHGGLDIWIHNAGADTLTGEAAKWPFERKLDELLKVDLVACMRMARAAGAAMKDAGGGSIVTIGWDRAEAGMAGDSGELFAAVKAAIHGFTKSLAKSLAPRVRVNCIAPGWIRTTWGNAASEAWQERVRSESLSGRWGLPEDVARLARFLASEEAAYINGQVIDVNGGMVP